MDSRLPETDDTGSWSAELRAVDGPANPRPADAQDSLQTAQGASLAPEPLLQVLAEPDPWPQDDRLAMLLGMADGADEACYREGHSRRVAGLVRILVAEEGLPDVQVEALVIAARLHDIGKMGMPLRWIEDAAHDAEALHKLREHAARSAEFVTGLPIPQAARDAIRNHHEWWDGSGYPDGMRGADIPIGARIIGLAEAIDAATAPAPPAHAWTLAHVLASIRSDAGRRWDPEIAARLPRVLLPALLAASRRGGMDGEGTDHRRSSTSDHEARLA